MEIISGPRGSFSHTIRIVDIKGGKAYVELLNIGDKQAQTPMDLGAIIKAIKDDYWRIKYTLKDYIKEIER